MKRAEMAGYKIRLIHNEIHKRMETKRLKNKDEATGMQRWIMGYLMEHDGEEIYQRDIEAEFSVSRATASHMLAVMERKELVCRLSVAHDARLKRLVLTERAKKMVSQARADVNEMEELLTAGMTQEERAQFLACLDRVLENLHNGPDGAVEAKESCTCEGRKGI